jgi:predicted nucleotidyltransferase
MTTFEVLRQKRHQILAIASKHGVTSIRVFGSVVRHEDSGGSDVDFLVKTGPKTSSWFPAGLVLDLEDLLGRRVEVVTENGLNPLIRDRVLAEAVAL